MTAVTALLAQLVPEVPEPVLREFTRRLVEKASSIDLDDKLYSEFSIVRLGFDLAQIVAELCLEGRLPRRMCSVRKLGDLLHVFADIDPETGPRAALELLITGRSEIEKLVDTLVGLYRSGVERGLEKARKKIEYAEIEKIISGKLKTFDEVWRVIKEKSYDFKLKLARAVVREALKLHRKWNGNSSIIVFWSGGKSSTAVLALVAEMLDPDEFTVVYNYTWLDPPCHLEYMRRVAKQLGIKHFYVTIPRVTPLVLFMLFGFPKPGRSGYREPICSLVLKKYAAIYAILKLNARTVFTGEQAVESEARMRAITKSGLIRQTNKYGGESLGRTIIKALPVGYWTRRDVEKYLQERGIEESPVYRILRSGRQCCLLCTNFVNWREVIENAAQMLGKPTLARTLELLIENWGWQRVNSISLAELAEKLRITRGVTGRRLSVEEKLRILDELFVIKKAEI